MEVEFADDRLALVRTDQATKTRLPIAVIISLRDKLVVLEAAQDERVLRAWKSFHYEKLKGRDGERSIRLNRQWRLVFRIEGNPKPKIIVLRVEDYH
ncbi:MAG: type II toxin-antitoxin system RelE/ParE family toxin [Devosia marina]|uniref:type II toxin-antitoxin system RelE/ParE family toxin n=1 Tax=Devosia marina TaxID=2683198 RepID=UPI0032EEE803